MKMPEARADLMKLSGQVGLNKPFRAPVYRTYYECIKGLYKQGLLAFYKGNGLRLTYGYLYVTIVNNIHAEYLDGDDVMDIKPSYGKSLAAGLCACVPLHFLHLAEARFVLQNRLPNFQSYASIFNLVRDSFTRSSGIKNEMFQGMPGYIPILSLFTLMNFQFLGPTSLQNLLIQGSVLQTLAYPFLTA